MSQVVEGGALVACPDCDLLHREQELSDGFRALCGRCDGLLYRADEGALDRVLALAVASAAFLLVANTFPVMAFSYAGQSQKTTLLDGVAMLAQGGLEFVALLVLMTSVVFPLLRVAGLLYVLVPLRFGRALPGARSLFRAASVMDRWGMLDVYSLAILVTVVKLGQLAEAHIETGCLAIVGAAVTMIAMGSSLDARDIWRRFEALR